jgi:hypothetical protein
MAACDTWVEDELKPKLLGRFLSVVESSDTLVGNCKKLWAASENVPEFKEIMLETGLKHGFLYRPLNEWIQPVLDFVHK